MASRLGSIPGSWWGKSPLAGVIGGVAMALVWGIGSAIGGQGFWYPMNVLGTTAPNPVMIGGDFSVKTLAGAQLHLLTAFMWGVVFGAIMGLVFPRATRSARLMGLAGLIFGVIVYGFFGLWVGPMINPAVGTINPLIYVVGHIVFGLVTGLSLYYMKGRREIPITFAPEVPVHERTATRR